MLRTPWLHPCCCSRLLRRLLLLQGGVRTKWKQQNLPSSAQHLQRLPVRKQLPVLQQLSHLQASRHNQRLTFTQCQLISQCLGHMYVQERLSLGDLCSRESLSTIPAEGTRRVRTVPQEQAHNSSMAVQGCLGQGCCAYC